jgi:TonB family protein
MFFKRISFISLASFSLFFLPTAITAQFKGLDEAAIKIDEKLKAENLTAVGVTFFRPLDGTHSPQGQYFAWYLSTGLEVANKRIKGVDFLKFSESLAKRHATVADLASQTELPEIASETKISAVITGVIENSAEGYTVHFIVRRVADASNQLEADAIVERSDFTDSLSEKWPPTTDYPVVKGIGVNSNEATLPACLRCDFPEYTAQGHSYGVRGTVLLEALISAEGKAVKVHPVRFLGYGLDVKAVEVVKRWRFKPAMRANGTPVAAIVPIEVTFNF